MFSDKLFYSSKVIGAIKDISWRAFFAAFCHFFKSAASSFRGQSSLLITSTSRHNINKLIKHKMCTMKFSFQKYAQSTDGLRVVKSPSIEQKFKKIPSALDY